MWARCIPRAPPQSGQTKIEKSFALAGVIGRAHALDGLDIISQQLGHRRIRGGAAEEVVVAESNRLAAGISV